MIHCTSLYDGGYFLFLAATVLFKHCIIRSGILKKIKMGFIVPNIIFLMVPEIETLLYPLILPKHAWFRQYLECYIDLLSKPVKVLYIFRSKGESEILLAWQIVQISPHLYVGLESNVSDEPAGNS